MNVTEIIQGSTIEWEVELCDYLPSDGWALKYYIRGAGTGLDVTGTDDDDDDVFELVITATQTAGLAIGNWSWQSFAEKDAEKFLISQGNFKVKEGFATIAAATTFDGRSQVKIALDAIDAVIAGKATLDQQEYTIGNRSLRRYAMSDLIALRKEYQRLYNEELRAERARQGKGTLMTPFYSRFRNPR
jgi:hypothetical protein